jgi:glycosyltransferase involved in cell wall biosynthesis
VSVTFGCQRLGAFGSYREIFEGCNSEFLVQLDADDRLHPSALESALLVIKKAPDSPFLYTQALLIDSKGRPKGLEPRSLRQWQPNLDLVQFLYFHMRLVRSEQYHLVSGYDNSYSYAGDYDLSLRLAELGKPSCLNHPLYYYRLHGQSASQKQRRITHLEACRASRAAICRRGLEKQIRLIQGETSEVFCLEERRVFPLAIVGMHRSGTSLLSRFLEVLGVDFGNQLIGADRDQPDGYFEDQELVSMHRKWFAESIKDRLSGWADWGWAPNESISCLGKRKWKLDAQSWLQSFVAKCSTESHCGALNHREAYGWKDPRTTLLLPFWHDCCPALKVIGIYRTPWDLSDALQRLSHPQFRVHPETILPLWRTYNERLVEFVEARSEHAVLVHAESLAAHPSRLRKVLQNRWDWQWNKRLSDDWHLGLLDKSRLTHLPPDDPIVGLYSAVMPEAYSLLLRLQQCADLPFEGLDCSAHEFKGYKAPLSPEVTVIIPTFNPGHWLLECIASVHRHTSFPGSVEIIIINDGSCLSESCLLLDRLQAVGYSVVHQKNTGLSAARNRGFELARSGLVLPLDDDNRLLSPYLNDGLELLNREPLIDFAYGDRVDFGASRQLFRPGQIEFGDLWRENRVDACALIRKKLWQDIGGYDENMKALEDWDFWLSASRRGANAAYIRKPCFEYRVRENSMLRKLLANPADFSSTVEYMRQKHREQASSSHNENPN